MSRRTLSWLIGGGVALIALFLVLTTVPVVHGEARSKQASAAAVGPVDQQDCLDVTFAVPVTYSVTKPLLDIWGFERVDDVLLNHAVVSVAARPECADGLEASGATAYVNAPVCQSGLCEDAYVTYRTATGDASTGASMTFEGTETLPGSAITSSPWCLEFAAEVQYASGGAGVSDVARVTDSDFCLDLS